MLGERLEVISLLETADKHTPYNNWQEDTQACSSASFPRHSITIPTFLFMQGKSGITELMFLHKQHIFPVVHDFQKNGLPNTSKEHSKSFLTATKACIVRVHRRSVTHIFMRRISCCMASLEHP